MRKSHYYVTLLCLAACRFQETHSFGPSAAHFRRETMELFNRQEQSAETIENVEQPAEATFCTSPMHVYIEYTDAFGVVYNGNYLKFFDRALHRTDQLRLDDWSIVRVGEQKFKQSPELGGTFVIEGVRKEVHEAYEVWDMDMKSVDNLIVFNSVTDVRIAKAVKGDIALPTDAPFDIPESGVLATDKFLRIVMSSSRISRAQCPYGMS
jgi:hypothetical protein